MNRSTFWHSALLVFLMGGFQAYAESSGRVPEVETKWPGVHFQVFRVERNSLNRLVVAVRIVATDKAPRSGTFLGTEIPRPANPDPVDVGMGVYDPKPFSLAASQMIDDATGKKYAVLPPLAPSGTIYLPDSTAKSLLPGQAEVLTIQFAVPPAPSGDETQTHTVSLLLPNAKAAIQRIPIPGASEIKDPPRN